ncbi:unnamed protein product [Leuciscus chuanchicus]
MVHCGHKGMDMVSNNTQGLVAKALVGFPNSSKETENESKLKPYGEFKQIGPLQLGANWTVVCDKRHWLQTGWGSQFSKAVN